jgi:site-specific recombinase XerD
MKPAKNPSREPAGKPTNFAKHMTAFFSSYLPVVKNLSPNTILSYRDAFRLLLAYCLDNENMPPEKLRIESFDDKLLLRFPDWLQQERGCSIATRNNRLAAIHTFFRYVQSQEPGQLLTCQLMLQVPFKKHQTPIIRHLTSEQTKDLLAAPGFATHKHRRDTTLLSVLYDSGARVQELCDLRIRDIRLDYPPVIQLTGKGRKTRHVPLMANTTELLRSYMEENKLFQNGNQDMPLFFNQRRSKLTRGGVSYILRKYADSISVKYPDIPEKLTPHVLRHSKAMHMYQSGVNLVYIRDILGHVDIATTDTYARADTESKRKVLEEVYPDITPSDELPDWGRDLNLLDYLNQL